VQFLYICHHDLTRGFDAVRVKRALNRVPFVVFQGSWDHATASLGEVQLPAAVYAEKDGTFTNVQGRVQRIRRALAPLGESLPDLEILARLAREAGLCLLEAQPAEVFLELAKNVPAFAGMSYESIGQSGQQLG